MSMIVC